MHGNYQLLARSPSANFAVEMGQPYVSRGPRRKFQTARGLLGRFQRMHSHAICSAGGRRSCRAASQTCLEAEMCHEGSLVCPPLANSVKVCKE
ncbi:hypothetical protein MHYP_G00278280 [Metynnis hypsauchen]